MKKTLAFLCLIMLSASGCATYTSAAKIGNQVYLTGAGNWVKRCTETQTQLICEKLEVQEGNVPLEVVPAVSPENRQKQLEAMMPSLRSRKTP
ncbi:hypothetical protein L6259_02385 [Candidatus Parcubacteria bacterium]|nr:hypothetical protein [Patescibacteria group bacterium]MCG2694097.1 hypothetical protein [Candidatus Parcubacteria bacterium]